jgi:hypothetical protein
LERNSHISKSFEFFSESLLSYFSKYNNVFDIAKILHINTRKPKQIPLTLFCGEYHMFANSFYSFGLHFLGIFPGLDYPIVPFLPVPPEHTFVIGK